MPLDGLASCVLALLVALFALAASGCSGSLGVGAATPTAATPQGRLSARVHQALLGSGASSEVTYDSSVRSTEVVMTLSNYMVPSTPAAVVRTQELVKTLCFKAQQATWTSEEPLTKVTASVKGPQYDDYADVIVQGYGGAILSSAVATHLEWARLTADAAWNRYDQTWFSSEFRPFQQYWETPTATANP
jgi:hypothetical protein